MIQRRNRQKNQVGIYTVPVETSNIKLCRIKYRYVKQFSEAWIRVYYKCIDLDVFNQEKSST